MENQNPRVSPLWEQSLTTLLGHDPTSDPDIALRQWVHFQGVHNILDLLSWDQEELKAVPATQVYSLDDHGRGLYIRTNQIKQMCGLIPNMKHVFGAYNSDIYLRDDPFHPFTPDEWSQQTSTMLRTYFIQHLPNPNGPEPVPSGPIPSSRPTGYSPATIELLGFKKGIKREIAAYPSLKDERYFDGFKRSLLIVAETHECNEVLDPNYTPGSEPEKPEFFEAKQTLMFSVFNANLQTDMGKTIVRRHLANTDAQSVWNSLSYDTYYDLLINACVRYDKTKKANIGKRRNVYNTNIDDTYVDHPTACIDHVLNAPYGGIDLPPDAIYQVHALSSMHPPSPRPGNPSRPSFWPQSLNSGPTKLIRRYDGPIFLPPQIHKLLSQDAMEALKAYNTEAINRFHQRKVHNTEIVETPQDEPPGPQYLKMTSLSILKVT